MRIIRISIFQHYTSCVHHSIIVMMPLPGPLPRLLALRSLSISVHRRGHLQFFRTAWYGDGLYHTLWSSAWYWGSIRGYCLKRAICPHDHAHRLGIQYHQSEILLHCGNLGPGYHGKAMFVSFPNIMVQWWSGCYTTVRWWRRRRYWGKFALVAMLSEETESACDYVNGVEVDGHRLSIQ